MGFKWLLMERWGKERLTHSDQGEDVVHVRADVDLHKSHNHSHLLEEELRNRRETETSRYAVDFEDEINKYMNK